MQAQTVKEVLIATRHIIDNFGWCQGKYFQGKDGKTLLTVSENSLGGCCLSGAMMLVDSYSAAKNEAYVLLHNTILDIKQYKQFIGGQSIPGWNDTPGRTKEQVLSLLDTLIEKA